MTALCPSNEPVEESIDQLQTLYARGVASRLSSTPVHAQAEDLGWKESRLKLARRFADPETGYNPARLATLFERMRTRGTTLCQGVIRELLSVPVGGRDLFEQQCVAGRYSIKQAFQARKAQNQPRRPNSGRPRQTTLERAPVQFEEAGSAWSRLIEALKKTTGDGPSVWSSLSPALRACCNAVTPAMRALRLAATNALQQSRTPS